MPAHHPPLSKGHKPSLSKSMAWLGRGSTQYTSSKPLRISEPKFVNAVEVLCPPRRGTLGSGAIVVKTPQDALSAQFYDEEEEYEVRHDNGGVYQQDERRKLSSTPGSPDLPPIPLGQNVSELPLVEKPVVPLVPIRSPPVISASITLFPSLKNRSSGHSELLPTVHRFPTNVTSALAPPPFRPILVGAPPTGAVDPSKLIVALETGTCIHRTTISTLTSRPSRLSTYLKSLLPQPEADAASVHSHTSEVSLPDSSFDSIFHQHLVSSGLLTQASPSIHIFLDRPSASYTYIMAYLRSTPTAERPAMLPRAVQLIPTSPSRLEVLLELRDEASYLDLEELRQLCNAEIQRRESVTSHTRVGSGGSMHSVHTFRDRPSSEPHHAKEPSNGPRHDSIVTHRSAPKERDSAATRSTEQIVQPTKARPSHSRSRSHGRSDRTMPLRSPPLCPTPPPGWI